MSGRQWLLVAGAVCFAAALFLVGLHLLAFESVVEVAAGLFSADGIVEAANRRALSVALLSAAALVALIGVLPVALSIPAWRTTLAALAAWDPLRRLGLHVPNPYLVLLSSLTLGGLFIGIHLAGRRLGGLFGWLFQKEGPFELLTAALALAAAVWCIAATRRWRKYRKSVSRGVPVLYAALALILFLVAMEELNWGQTLLAFETPATWAAVNHQQETSLHNLLDGPTLIVVERWLAVLFGVGVLALIALAIWKPRSVLAAIAPPASLAVFAAFCATAGAYPVRAEVFELLMAVFFAFYSYRIYVAAGNRSSRHSLPAGDYRGS